MFFRIKNFFLFCFFCFTSGCILVSFYIFITYPKLPDVRSLDVYRPSTPLQIFDRNGSLITKIGVEKRVFISEEQTRHDAVKVAVGQGIRHAPNPGAAPRKQSSRWPLSGTSNHSMARAPCWRRSGGRPPCLPCAWSRWCARRRSPPRP